ncbi:hypothetical protein KM043_004487 [Ampulex compressa]|nr:hypothetical protein KM043_004487 [Ampulex compressa]
MYTDKIRLTVCAVLTCAIGVCSVIGDLGLERGKSELTRAIFDNVTHATVGGLTWALIIVLSKKSLIQNLPSIFLCFLMASFIDVDHFLAAGSWDLNNATHLKRRPFLHCTTIPIVTSVLLIIAGKMFNYTKLNYISWMISASFLSHHIRDGTRRGLWFWPLGSTPPIPYHLYLTLAMLLPHILQWIMPMHLHYAERMYDNTSTIPLIQI